MILSGSKSSIICRPRVSTSWPSTASPFARSCRAVPSCSGLMSRSAGERGDFRRELTLEILRRARCAPTELLYTCCIHVYHVIKTYTCLWNHMYVYVKRVFAVFSGSYGLFPRCGLITDFFNDFMVSGPAECHILRCVRRHAARWSNHLWTTFLHVEGLLRCKGLAKHLFVCSAS